MKNLFYLCCLAIASSLVFSACEKGDVELETISQTSLTVDDSENLMGVENSERENDEATGCNCKYRMISLSETTELSQPQTAASVHYLGDIPYSVPSYSRINASYDNSSQIYSWQTFSDNVATSGFVQHFPSNYVSFLPGSYTSSEIQSHRLDFLTFDPNPNLSVGIEVICSERKVLNEPSDFYTFNYLFTKPVDAGQMWSENICVACRHVAHHECNEDHSSNDN